MKNLIASQNIWLISVLFLVFVIYSACHSDKHTIPTHGSTKDSVKAETINPGVIDSTAVLKQKQVPILCYHQIREWLPSDSKRAKDYIVPVNNFREQIKMLADSGYHTIVPDQLYDYLLKGTPLPAKPIMLSFDDNRAEHFTIANEEMKKYGFKGVFFIMTVSLNRPHYMTREQVKQLFDEGNTIGSHTWDHGNVKTYLAEDWVKQVDKPTQQLEQITGKRPEYFAYPFGLWNKEAVEQIKQRGFKAAFQLSAKLDKENPLFTIRRIIVPGEWSTRTLKKWIDRSF